MSSKLDSVYEVQESLLYFDNDDCACKKARKGYRFSNWCFLHLVLITTYTIAIAFGISKWGKSRDFAANVDLYSPASSALEYDIRVVDINPSTFARNNPYVGDPRPELDDAWNKLTNNMQIWVDEEQFARLRPQLNQSTLKLPDGSSVIRLAVYHELHCIKWIRKWMFREHYWPDLSGAALVERRWHIEHCLDILRLRIMCNPPLYPDTFFFLNRTANNNITAERTHLEKCVKWDRLDGWAEKRRVDFNELDKSTLIE